MDKLTKEQIEMLRFFCLKLIPDFKKETYNMPYLNFVFTEKDLDYISFYLKSMEVKNNQVRLDMRTRLAERDVDVSVIDEVINILKRTQEEQEENPNENSIYILVPNAKEFFTLLESIKENFEEHSSFNNFSLTSLIRSIWLRMGVSDVTNVYTFLNRQKKFIKNDYLFNANETAFCELGSLEVSYENHGNLAWFETNRHMRFFIKKKKGECVDNFENKYVYYCLPVIHYALIKENDIPTCYIYGIQNLDSLSKDDEVKDEFQELRKNLRNKEVASDYIIVLKLFIELLSEKGITCIKVPLMQVFNYEYHENLGATYKKTLDSLYSKEEQVTLNAILEQDTDDEYVREYKYLKKLCDNCYGKEDIISKNKTERLISTFKLVREHYHNLEFANDPFIEGDNLICHIVENNIKKL